MQHSSIAKRLKSFAGTLIGMASDKIFIYLMLLNISANLFGYVFFKSSFAIVGFILLGAFIAYIEAAIIRIFAKTKYLKNTLLITIAVFTNILILTDLFLARTFNLIIGEDAINILANTNSAEAASFIDTYLNAGNIATLICIIAAINFGSWFIAKFIVRIRRLSLFNIILIIGGGYLLCLCVYNQKVHGNGLGIPQYSSPTRFAHSCYLLNARVQSINIVTDICTSARSTATIQDDRIIVLVIGESFSRYHSSLYDYPHDTNPKLKALKNSGELFVFDNAVTPYNATHAVMSHIFSLGEFPNSPLFPSCFKDAGYHTHISENQYNIGASLNFLTDKHLSDIMFDSRKDFNYEYDMTLVDSTDIDTDHALYIFHLKGQHYTYADCYPADFNYFTPNDYDNQKYNTKQRSIIAHYDNATRYNDHVTACIIDNCRDKNVCLIYFPDHGEEIFETRDYMGHGDAGSDRHSLDLQIKIPFMMWMSDKFKTANPDIATKVADNLHTPITTKDVPHLLLGLGGITNDFYDPTRDFLNDKYNKTPRRIVLKSIDYDQQH